ncbi:MAG: thiamine phosphate synthase [Firmicutes bacterium]|nr:thiamine phosphate synthase [Bacillota bacterium]
MNRNDLKVYLITDNNALNGRDFFETIEDALENGVTMVQLREKNLSAADFLKKANKLKKLTDKYNVPLIINDRVDIAFDCGAAGLHIGQNDISVRDGRRIIRRDMNKILGVTANTVPLALEAEKLGADYIGAGAIFATSTKSGAKHISVDELREIAKSVSIPVVAIGGITAQNAHVLEGTKIAGVAVSSGIMRAENIGDVVKTLKALEL